jgi:quercetin dioxygenase-like cupin family protein
VNTAATLTPGTTLQVVTDLITILVTPEQSRGAYLLFISRTAPGAGIPPHRHNQEDEAFFVLRGTYAFLRDGEQLVLGAGQSVFVPRGMAHSFQNVDQAESELLIVTSPGRLHEGFFADLGIALEPGATERVGPPAIPAIVEAAARHGIEMLPPQ